MCEWEYMNVRGRIYECESENICMWEGIYMNVRVRMYECESENICMWEGIYMYVRGECMYVRGECMYVRGPEWIMSCTAPHTKPQNKLSNRYCKIQNTRK